MVFPVPPNVLNWAKLWPKKGIKFRLSFRIILKWQPCSSPEPQPYSSSEWQLKPTLNLQINPKIAESPKKFASGAFKEVDLPFTKPLAPSGEGAVAVKWTTHEHWLWGWEWYSFPPAPTPMQFVSLSIHIHCTDVFSMTLPKGLISCSAGFFHCRQSIYSAAFGVNCHSETGWLGGLQSGTWRDNGCGSCFFFFLSRTDKPVRKCLSHPYFVK